MVTPILVIAKDFRMASKAGGVLTIFYRFPITIGGKGGFKERGF